jgi:hypothetical protein
MKTSQQFPGAPANINLVMSEQFHEASKKLAMGNINSRNLANIYKGLSLCLVAPRSYFDLFTEISTYYDEFIAYWNKEIVAKNSGSKGLSMMDVSKTDIDTSIIDDMDGQCFTLLMGVLSFTQKEATPQNGPFGEQMSVLNKIVWAMYIGCFRMDFFNKNVRVFEEAYKRAKVEQGESAKYRNN